MLNLLRQVLNPGLSGLGFDFRQLTEIYIDIHKETFTQSFKLRKVNR